jgi:phosphatidate cytidylyltransferase
MPPLRERTLTGIVGIPLVLGWLWVSFRYERPELVVLLLAIVAGVASWEYARLLCRMGLVVSPPLLTVGEVLGLVYIPFLLRFFYDLLREERGFGRVVGLLVLVWAYDTGAFLAGSRWGRRKLAPRLSPGKTWEGVLGGLVAASLAALGLLSWIAPELSVLMRVGHALGLSVLVSAAAQLGDLFESLLKRAAGAKDSGGLFPGHGGMLDRIDALLFALPVYALYTRYLFP